MIINILLTIRFSINCFCGCYCFCMLSTLNDHWNTRMKIISSPTLSFHSLFVDIGCRRLTYRSPLQIPLRETPASVAIVVYYFVISKAWSWMVITARNDQIPRTACISAVVGVRLIDLHFEFPWEKLQHPRQYRSSILLCDLKGMVMNGHHRPQRSNSSNCLYSHQITASWLLAFLFKFLRKLAPALTVLRCDHNDTRYFWQCSHGIFITDVNTIVSLLLFVFVCCCYETFLKISNNLKTAGRRTNDRFK